MSKITPIGNRVLVERPTAKTETAGGILLGEQSQEKPLEGVILAISESNYDDNGDKVEFNVKVGDRVTFASWGSDLDLTIEEKVLSFITEDNIIGILR